MEIATLATTDCLYGAPQTRKFHQKYFSQKLYKIEDLISPKSILTYRSLKEYFPKKKNSPKRGFSPKGFSPETVKINYYIFINKGQSTLRQLLMVAMLDIYFI